MGEAGGGRWWWCGVVLGRGWSLVVGRVCGGYPPKFDLRKRALRREPCPGSNFRRFFSIFFFLFFFLMPVLSTWFSVLELKGTYVTLRTFSSSTETVLCTSTST